MMSDPNIVEFLFPPNELQMEILADQVVAVSRRNPRFRTDPVAAIYSAWAELGREIARRMGGIRVEERKTRGVVRQ